MMIGWKAADARVMYMRKRGLALAPAPIESEYEDRIFIFRERTWKNTLTKLTGEMYSKRKYVSTIFPIKTHNKKHEGTRRPSKSNIVAVTAKEQSTEHCENHPEK